MRNHRHMGLMLVALAATSAGVLLPDVREARQPVPPKSRTPERLTKAEKKRARKAAQRLKLAQRAEGKTVSEDARHE